MSVLEEKADEIKKAISDGGLIRDVADHYGVPIEDLYAWMEQIPMDQLTDVLAGEYPDASQN